MFLRSYSICLGRDKSENNAEECWLIIQLYNLIHIPVTSLEQSYSDFGLDLSDIAGIVFYFGFRQLIYNYPEQLFADAGVMAIEHADFDGIERLALVTGGEIVSTFDSPETVQLGHCKLIEQVC